MDSLVVQRLCYSLQRNVIIVKSKEMGKSFGSDLALCQGFSGIYVDLGQSALWENAACDAALFLFILF